MKHCNNCNSNKPINKFYKNSGSKDNLDTYCKECRLSRNKIWRKNNPEKVKNVQKQWKSKNRKRYNEINLKWKKDNTQKVIESGIKYRYGLDPVSYRKMLEDQGHKCMICNRHESELKQRLNIDHNHETGVVRGLLCDICNRGLGFLGADRGTHLLRAAILYLEKDKKNGRK
jgi:hypothetical protein